MWYERWLSCIDPALAIGRVIITTGKECNFQIKPRHQMQKKLNTYPAADADLNAWSKYQKYPTRLLVEGEIQRWCDFDQSLIVPILQLRDRYSQSMWPKVTLSNSCIVLTIASSSILQTLSSPELEPSFMLENRQHVTETDRSEAATLAAGQIGRSKQRPALADLRSLNHVNGCWAPLEKYGGATILPEAT